MKYREAVDAADVRRALDYDPETGVFRWKFRDDRDKTWNTRFSGKAAGSTQKFNYDKLYVVIRLNRILYLAHRLAWLYVTGEWPERDIDHENRNSIDNRFTNLRPATMSQNQFNRAKQRDNKSGYKGIHRHGQKWRAQIAANGQKLMESFVHIEDAITWHKKMTIMLHGDFAPKEPIESEQPIPDDRRAP